MNTTPSPIRVLLWSPSGAGSHYNGPGTSAYRLYRKRNPAELSITLVHGATNQAADAEVYKDQIFIGDSKPTDIVRNTPFLGKAALYSKRTLFIKRARQWLVHNAKQFDVFHGLANFSPTLAPALIAKDLGLPVCTKVAGLGAELENGSTMRSLLGIAERRGRYMAMLDAVIAISTEIEQRLIALGLPEEKIACIPNGCDTSYFRPPASVAEREENRHFFGLNDGLTIAFVGERTERKGLHFLIKCFDDLTKRIDCQLIIAGPRTDTAYAARIDKMIDSIDASEQVKVFDHVQDIAKLYRASDIFCLPSADEGLPNALLEAMASGLPCVITPFSSARDVIEHGVSGLIARREVDDLYTALLTLMRDDAVRVSLGQNAHDRVQTHFSTEVVLKKHIQLFSNLIAGRPIR